MMGKGTKKEEKWIALFQAAGKCAHNSLYKWPSSCETFNAYSPLLVHHKYPPWHQKVNWENKQGVLSPARKISLFFLSCYLLKVSRG